MMFRSQALSLVAALVVSNGAGPSGAFTLSSVVPLGGWNTHAHGHMRSRSSRSATILSSLHPHSRSLSHSRSRSRVRLSVTATEEGADNETTEAPTPVTLEKNKQGIWDLNAKAEHL